MNSFSMDGVNTAKKALHYPYKEYFKVIKKENNDFEPKSCLLKRSQAKKGVTGTF